MSVRHGSEIGNNMTKLGHIVLYVKDLDNSANFYRDIVRLSAQGKIFNDRAAVLTGGNTHHELMLIQVGSAPGPLHGKRIGLYPRSNCMSINSIMPGNTITTGWKPRSNHCGLISDATVSHRYPPAWFFAKLTVPITSSRCFLLTNRLILIHEYHKTVSLPTYHRPGFNPD